MFNSFRGGIHPQDQKHYSRHKAIEIMPVPERLVLPLRQHIGAPAEPIVAVGDHVKKGQCIAKSVGLVSSPIHAPTSGTVAAIAVQPHPGFGTDKAIVLDADGEDAWLDGVLTERDWHLLSKEELLTIIREAGVVGLGGAAFPTHVKLNPPPDKKIDTLIINGAECEPYLTADHRVMLEAPDKMLEGIQIAMKLLGLQEAMIGIEKNKEDAVAFLEEKCKGTAIKVCPLQTKYPQGAEKMLIRALTGREVPSGGLPADVGIIVQNIGTVAAISDAVSHGIPLIERVVTVSGGLVKEPKNILVRLGTSFQQAVDWCGGLTGKPAKIVMGGPMMGMAQAGLNVPIIKGTSGILLLAESDIGGGKERGCIRCGRCVEVCPMGLMPNRFAIWGQRGEVENAVKEGHLLDCAECGSCVYVCPAKRNIVHYIKLLKAKNAAKKK